LWYSVPQALDNVFRQLINEVYLPQAGVDQGREPPTLSLAEDCLPVGTTLQQRPDLLNIGIRSRARQEKAVF
jgi:hypothetical protein